MSAATRVLGAPLARCAAVAAGVVVVDLASKVAAVALLDGRVVPLAGGVTLTTVYNDTFARGMALGPLTTPATLALTLFVLALAWRVCAALARHDAMAPTALGLMAGAAIGNAADFVRTGIGAVDFIAVPTAEGAIVFNLADVAAYLGVVLLVRTLVVLARAVVRERRVPVATHAQLHAEAPRTVRRVVQEVAVAVPLFVEQDGIAPQPRAAADVRRDVRLTDVATRRVELPARGAPPESHDTAELRVEQHRSNARTR